MFPLEGCGFFGAASGPEQEFYPRDVVVIGVLEGLDDDVAFFRFKGGPKVLVVFDDAQLFRHADEGVAIVKFGPTSPFTAGVELLNEATGGFGGTAGQKPVANLDSAFKGLGETSDRGGGFGVVDLDGACRKLLGSEGGVGLPEHSKLSGRDGSLGLWAGHWITDRSIGYG